MVVVVATEVGSVVVMAMEVGSVVVVAMEVGLVVVVAMEVGLVVVATVVALAVLHRIGSGLALDISTFRGLLCSRAVGRPST